MTALDSPSHENAGVHFDAGFLLQQVPALAQVTRRHRTWDEFGIRIARELQPGAHRKPQSGADPDSSLWSRARELVHAVMVERDPRFDPIRKRLGRLRNPATPALLSTLSLWLAGQLGISVSATQPMVAAMLYAVSEASENWEILRSF